MVASTALSVYQRMSDPLAAVQMLGRAIAASRMFGVENEAQGQVFALECLTRGTPPLALQEEYHVIHGGLSMKTDKMLANFNAMGGKHKIVSRTAEKAAVELSMDGKVETFVFTWDEAQKEPFVYQGKEKDVVASLAKGEKPALKDKYATPRSRMQMLWARVVSDGVRAVCPSANHGRYTPDELGGHEDAGNGEVVDAEFEVKATTAETTPTAAASNSPATEAPSSSANDQVATATAAAAEPEYATSEQVKRISELFSELKLPHERQVQALQKRKATAIHSLVRDVAGELITILEVKLGQVNKIKELLKEVEQSSPGISAKVQERIKATGREKLAELTNDESNKLIDALTRKEMEAFFEKSLLPKAAEQPATNAGN